MNLFSRSNRKFYGNWYLYICLQVLHKVDLHEIFSLIKNTATTFNNIPINYIEETKKVYENGKSIPLQSAIIKRREQMELPELPEIQVKDIQTLMEATDIMDAINPKESQHKEESN